MSTATPAAPQADTLPTLSALPGAPRERWRAFQADRTIHHTPRPLLRADKRIVTMGSCFANELRAYLLGNDIGQLSPRVPESVLPLMHDASKEETSWGPWNGLSNLQWYNTFTIRQEVERAVGLWRHDPEDYWTINVKGETLYQCPYRRRIFADSPEKLAEITRAIDEDVRRGFAESELVIWTLGLIEVWRAHASGRFSCAEPGYCWGGGAAETSFHLSTYEENLDNVRTAVRLLREHFGPKEVVLTVSPVPLGRTFREGVDIAIANMESKSTLRTVAGAIEREFEEVEYFPAYELCMLEGNAFREDGRHVRREKVAQIMDFFVASHS